MLGTLIDIPYRSGMLGLTTQTVTVGASVAKTGNGFAVAELIERSPARGAIEIGSAACHVCAICSNLVGSSARLFLLDYAVQRC